jgi:ribosomal protein S18 acetylase RimI-like enzyme
VTTAEIIRPARLDDLPVLVQLEALFPSDALSRRSLRRFITAPNAVFLVADIDGGVLGNLLMLTRARSRVARIYSLIVDPAARGRGLARQLVIAAFNAAASRGAQALSLEVRTDNQAARALYESLGFEIVDTLPGYYDDGADGLRLARRIGTTRDTG